jgi:hypothetical protein
MAGKGEDAFCQIYLILQKDSRENKRRKQAKKTSGENKRRKQAEKTSGEKHASI